MNPYKYEMKAELLTHKMLITIISNPFYVAHLCHFFINYI